MVPWLATGAVRPVIDARFPLDDVRRAHERMESNDSFEFFHRLHDLVVTGPTGTNVGDLQIFLTGATDASC